MSSRREEERNEKIIRGLMKLPPNRRCINCNSLGPQYVCTTFWTFICTTCSGIHREFTHRVKSVSMAKFTSQEVDSLQNGGNQRARELYLKAWDSQRQRLPDNSNVDKVREFIKNVYVCKSYFVEKSSDRPPRDPQGLHEDETRRASSYHSFSQSPPYDFEYEKRRYGKHAPALSRKPGSDRGIYEGKFSSFLSPSRSSDHADDNSSQRDTGSLQNHTINKSDANNRSNGGRILHPQRSSSLGSFRSIDSNSTFFKPVNSMGFPEVSSKPEPSAEISEDKSSSFTSLVQSSASGNFDGLDLFAAPFAPQHFTSAPPTGSNSQLLQLSSTQSSDFFQQYPVSSVPTFTEQQPAQTPQASSIDLFSQLSQQQPTAVTHSNITEGVIPNIGGWATFDMGQNLVPLGVEKAPPASAPSSERNISGNFNPFSFYQSSSSSTGHEASASSHFWQEGLQNVEASTKSTPLWNAFENSAEEQPIPNMLNSNDQAVEHHGFDAHNAFSASEVLNNAGNVRAPHASETPSSSLSSHFSVALHDFSMAGLHSVATEHNPGNPFDLPYDTKIESGDMSQFWDMSSLQASLPNIQKSASYVGDIHQSWFHQNSIPSYIPGGVTFDHQTGSLGIVGQTPSTHISNIPAQAPVGGNPFA